VRVRTDGYTDTLTDVNRFYNLSHAICYSYGTDKYACLYRSIYLIKNGTRKAKMHVW